MPKSPINIREAQRLGYVPVTDEYTDDEFDLLVNACKDLSGCDFVLVRLIGGTAIYRKKSEVDKLQQTTA